ncbi:MAG: Lrp/AsnC family transcriptional regulator [Rhodocyclaceae bacterium]|jgi:DNA-binding Lrp family transcriptional regulator|nr:Lrp/AsnC family transcriptional regulator [Rhodocyclaceae bacterium]
MKPVAMPLASDADDRALVLATQGGLPLTPQPYHAIAAELGLAPVEVMQRLRSMLARGMIRRIGVVPNHYSIGYTANGMSVWDIDDDAADAVGELIGTLPAVTHCYRRPRQLPLWRYNLFAMVHGRCREEAVDQVAAIAALIESEFPASYRAHEILFSTRILKKTGLRIAG